MKATDLTSTGGTSSSKTGMASVSFVQPPLPMITTSTQMLLAPGAPELSLPVAGSNYHGQQNGPRSTLWLKNWCP